jgi:hypothetical protein
MMRNKLLFIALFISCLAVGQQANNVVLTWVDNVKSSVGENPVTMPQFQAEYMNFNPSRKLLSFQMNLPVAGPVKQNSLVISNIVYESITAAQLGDLSPSAVPSALNAKLQAAQARNEWRAVVTLSPIIKDGSGFKRVKSFSYSYTMDASASTARNAADFDELSNSVLASGEWFRFYVQSSGVYKVSKSFLQQLGMNVNVDPRNIKIYGNGGRMVPLLNSIEYPADLAENAINFIGEEDGVFNNEDYILFYAEGVDNWSRENGTHNNLYADKSYYYVTSGGGPGKRVQAMVQPGAAANITATTFDDYHYYERDLINIARLGRKWHGEQFNVENDQNFNFNIPDLVPGQPVSLKVSAASNAIAATNMAIKANGAAVGTISFTPPGQYDAARDGFFSGSFTPSGGAITINLTYNNNGIPGSNAFLDYIILEAKRFLKGTGRQFRFRYNDAASNIGVIEYQLTNAAGIYQVWDITDIYNVTTVYNTSQPQLFFKAPLGEVREYIAVVPADYYTPLREANARVANQNLKGTIFNNAQNQFQDVDYIIITPASLIPAAERLANFHRTQSQLNVKVVNLDNIYQEFSSGKQDIGAIRNFVKYVYYNASSDANRIKYLNLFGDASFDFKNRIPNNTNLVPILHAYDPDGVNDNYSIVTTFASDDFFVLMDPNEGALLNTNEFPDIAVGRMLVSSLTQAHQMVDKVMQYKSEEAFGRWRNEYVIITDDIDNENTDDDFVNQMEALADELYANRPWVNIRKIHSDSYVQEVSSGGERYPEAKDQIIRSINYGTLVVNYLGHGGEDGMAGERLLEKFDAQNLTNKYKYPLFITATCELTKFDNPYRPTTGEYLYWNTNGGAICMITTTRAIFISDAFTFNERLNRILYDFGPTAQGQYPSMAEALMRTKSINNNYRVIAFVGDPALKLAIPKPNIVLTEINDQPVGSGQVLESLAYVKLGGQVTDEQGNPMPAYNGELAVSVFDKPVSRHTLGNDFPTPIFPFTVLGETIFRGNATVTNGQFEFGFVVPRDIRIPVGAGRVSFYSKRNNVPEDQNGYNTAIQIGGINENAVADNTAPKVRLYMNDESFISGGITNESPIFLAFLEDEHGINTASGIGHDIIAILDGDETNAFILNDYYETELDDYTKGRLRFPFTNLAVGLHTITFKAWDVYNNLITAEIQFIVVGDDDMHLERVLNYPNPFVSYTEFWFTHNKPFEPLDVQVQVLTITGKVVKTINQSITTDGFLSRDIKWDGRDDFGDKIGKGVYIYKLTVRSTATGKKAEKYEKLVLL